MMNPASLSTLLGTATMVAATIMTPTMMTKKKETAAAVSLKFPILKICPPTTARMRMAIAAMVIAVTASTKVVVTRITMTKKGEEDGNCNDNKDIPLGKQVAPWAGMG